MMNHPLLQAYRESPWRVQLRWIGFFLAGLTLVALVAGLYLFVSAQATEAGYQIKRLQATLEAQTLEIANLRSELAYLTSANVMEQRARDLGFRPADMSQALYVPVDPSLARPEPQLAPPPSSSQRESLIKPAYRQSLWDWLVYDLLQVGKSPREARP